MSTWKYAIHPDEVKERGLSCLYYILDESGKSIFSNKTEKDFIKEGFTIVDENAFDSLLSIYENNLCGHWNEITEQEFEYALNVLPPLKWINGGFYISEADIGTIHGFYQRYNGRYYYSLQDIYTDREIIINSLKEYIERSDLVVC